MNALTRLWNYSILVRLGLVLGAATVLALAAMVAATIFTEQSTGKASAINVAGSLRMQSYALAVRIAAMGSAADADAAAARAAVEEFDRRLASPRLLGGLPDEAGAPLRADYHAVVGAWQRELRPLALAALADPAARTSFLQRVDGFVGQVDRFVAALDEDAERRIQFLRLALAGVFCAIVLLVAAAVALLHFEVVRPLTELLRSARAVRSGSFAARVAATGPDEMGQLGQAFNSMVEQLARLYGSLEKQVAEKTADLERKNRSLALLYDTTKALTEKPLEPATLRAVLDSVKAVLGVEGGIICARNAGSKRGFALVRDEAMSDELFNGHDCAQCFAPPAEGRAIAWRLYQTERGERRIVNVPLVDSGVSYGVMPLLLAPGKGLEAWQLELAETVGRHVGAALAAAARREEHQRLALHEERSAIARELHDSIAQALSYTKIQLARLSALLPRESAPQAQSVLADLREGVSDAYRQLRELLTTFRLKADSAGLVATLRQDAAAFIERSGVAVTVEEELSGVELSANEQVHLQQIVREALANIEKHAHARRASVRLARGEGRVIELVVEDDGVGLVADDSPRHHFGLSIMRDRARLLGGDLEIGPRVGGGTRLALRFEAAKTFNAPRTETTTE